MLAVLGIILLYLIQFLGGVCFFQVLKMAMLRFLHGREKIPKHPLPVWLLSLHQRAVLARVHRQARPCHVLKVTYLGSLRFSLAEVQNIDRFPHFTDIYKCVP